MPFYSYPSPLAWCLDPADEVPPPPRGARHAAGQSYTLQLGRLWQRLQSPSSPTESGIPNRREVSGVRRQVIAHAVRCFSSHLTPYASRFTFVRRRTIPQSTSSSSECISAWAPKYPVTLNPMATISMTALAVHCSGLVQTASPLTHRQARTTGTVAVRTRAADFPTDSQSTPPSRRLR